jgi:tetratricopeptide (TPR) repeat protein
MNLSRIQTLVSALLSVIACTAYSQGIVPQADSLKRQLQLELHDTTRSLVLAELSYLSYARLDTMYILAKQGLALATSIGFDRGIANNEVSLSAYYGNMSEYVRSTELILKALQWQKKKGSKKDLARCYLVLGFMEGKQMNPTDAIRFTKISAELFREARITDGIVICLNNLGSLFTETQQYDSSLFYLKEGNALAKAGSMKEMSGFISESIGEVYFLQGDFVTSEKYLREAIALRAGEDLAAQSNCYSMLADIHLKNGKIEDANTSVRMALKLADLAHSNEQRAQALETASDIFLETRDYSAALTNYKEAVRLRNIVFNDKRRNDYLNLINQFKMDEKESRIKLLEQAGDLRNMEIKLQGEKISTQRIYIITLSGLFVMFVALIFSLQKQSLLRKKHIAELEEKNQEIEKKARLLDKLNDELAHVNKNLEEKARERADKLEMYAFINSHKLRAPVATLLGLINLWEKDGLRETERQFALEAFKHEVSNIDRIVKEINETIEI